MKHHLKATVIPEETARVAKAVYRNGNIYLDMRDKFGHFYQDEEFSELFDHRGKRGTSPANLAMVMVMQYSEGLTDKQAVEAVRSRIDWKYMLGLELEDSGFDQSVLSRFRDRIVKGGQEQRLLDQMLREFDKHGYLDKSEQRTDSTHVIGMTRTLNRLELVGETMRAALSELAIIAPAWLQEQITPDWFDRYGDRFEMYRLPTKQDEQVLLRQQIGEDGHYLLQQFDEQNGSEIAGSEGDQMAVLRQVWLQQYMIEENTVKWREQNNIPPASRLIESPYDLEAHYGRKRHTKWVGYKAHLTETCSEGYPHLVTHVLTTSATTTDLAATTQIHHDLIDKSCLPERHYVDAGYISTNELVNAAEIGVDLVGPAPANSSWQEKETDAFDLSRFTIDWERQVATCPQGTESYIWSPSSDQSHIHVRFPKETCCSCPVRALCTQAKTAGRSLKILPEIPFNRLNQAREREKTDEFKQMYKRRAGVEGAISQAVRSFNLRRSSYVGKTKTHLRHLLIASAMSFSRMACWLRGDRHARTRITPFQALKYNFT